jgi:hypothetical protein
MRRGWATTEFWAALAVGLGTTAASLTGALPPRYAAIASAVAVGCFSLARGLAKVGPVPTAPAALEATAPLGTAAGPASAPTSTNAGALEQVTAPPEGTR